MWTVEVAEELQKAGGRIEAVVYCCPPVAIFANLGSIGWVICVFWCVRGGGYVFKLFPIPYCKTKTHGALGDDYGTHDAICDKSQT